MTSGANFELKNAGKSKVKNSPGDWRKKKQFS